MSFQGFINTKEAVMAEERKFKCTNCGHEWQVAHGTEKAGWEMVCPKCGSSNVHRADAGGRGRGQCGRRG